MVQNLSVLMFTRTSLHQVFLIALSAAKSLHKNLGTPCITIQKYAQCLKKDIGAGAYLNIFNECGDAIQKRHS